jgi:hypothetical protein
MINSDQIIHLRIDNKTRIIISVLVGLVFILFSGLSIYYVIIRPEPSEDFRIAAIALLPTAVTILFAWLFLLKLKGALSEQDLMEQTARILSKELPQAIARYVYSFSTQSDECFKVIDGETGKLDEIENLYSDASRKKLQEHLTIRSNVMVGVPACYYRFSGNAVPGKSLAAQLKMFLQMNVKRIEVHYTFPPCPDNLAACQQYFETTSRGTTGAGYKVEIVSNDKLCEMQARIEIGIDMLVNSRERLFIINDLAIMTAHVLHQFAGIKCQPDK